jgi:ABC-type antimicrobial peptide transport system permease subunit
MLARLQANGISVSADRQTVSAGFFRTLGVGLLSGREFDTRDTVAAPKVGIVNRMLAARLWPGADPVGRIVEVNAKKIQIVGVVRDFSYGSVWEGAQPALYIADSQSDYPASFLIVRTNAPPRNFISTLESQGNSLQPPSALYNFRSADELLKLALAPQRLAAGIFGAFGLLSIIVASVGLYSVMAYAIGRRTREIGIRLALGARPDNVMRLVLGKFMAVAVAGVLTGTLISLLLARFVASQVKGISAYDGPTFASVAILLGTVALCASAIPARRAARVQPQVALRSE